MDRRILPAALPLIGLMVLSSCRPLPEAPYPEVAALLPPDCSAVLRLDVPGNEALATDMMAGIGISEDEAASVLKRTVRLVVGFEPSPLGNLQPAHMAALGAWPRGFVGGALGPEWSKSDTGRHRWDGPDDWQLSLPDRRLVIASRNGLDSMSDDLRSAVLRSDWQVLLEDARDADVLLWTDSGAVLDSLMPMMAAGSDEPLLRAAVLALRRRVSGGYAAVVDLYPTDLQQLPSVALVLRLGLSMRFGMSPDPMERSLMEALDVAVEEQRIRLVLDQVPPELFGGLISAWTPPGDLFP